MNRRLVVVALVSLPACYLDPQGPPPPMGPPPQGGFGPVAQGGPPPGGGMAQGGTIEAGCSYSGNQLPGDIGGVFQVSCPPGCEAQGGLWGSDVYTADSGICRAGIHAGLITPAGGVVSVRLEPGRPAYRGSVRYGVPSSDYGQYPKSYTLFPAAAGPAAGPPPQQPGPYAQPAPAAYPAAPPPPPPPASYPPPQPAGYAPPPAGPAIEAGCSYSGNQIRGEIGTTVLVNCPPGCSQSGGLWGTDAYTADSGICRAAVHSGIISDRGGNVFVTLDPGRPAYRGSFRNGVRSNDYGNYPKSYHLSRP